MLRLCGAASLGVHHTSHLPVSGCKLPFESCRATLENLDLPKCLGGQKGRGGEGCPSAWEGRGCPSAWEGRGCPSAWEGRGCHSACDQVWGSLWDQYFVLTTAYTYTCR